MLPRDEYSSRTSSTAARVATLVPVLAALGILTVLSVAIGSKDISIGVVISSLLRDTGRGDAYVIWDQRVPRTVIVVCVGIALGVAGALVQALTRNALADPGILGVNAGAAFFVAVGIVSFGASSIDQYVWFAFVGALAATVAVYAIGSAGRRGADPVRLVLAGVALAAVLSGLTTGIKLTDPGAFDQIRNWNAGSVVGRDWGTLLPVLPFLVVGLLLAGVAAPSLNAIALGDDLARSLGTPVTSVRVVVVVAVTLLTGGATAIVGPVVFLGLMAPHVARWIVGPDQRWIMVYTTVLAPSVLLAADIVGRLPVRPGELPVGVVMAFVGAPVLVVMVRRSKASGL